MKKIIEQLGFQNVQEDMKDEHAVYFFATAASGAEMEIQVVHESGEIAGREQGFEDWQTIDFI